MKTFVPHKMLALSLNTQAKLDKQILRDKHDAILNSFVLSMKQMLVDKEFIVFDKERSDRLAASHVSSVAIEVNKLLYYIDTTLGSTATNIVDYYKKCAYHVNRISAYLIGIVSTIV